MYHIYIWHTECVCHCQGEEFVATIDEILQSVWKHSCNWSDWLEEGGVDEGEGDGAEAFDLDNDMLVVADAAGVA